MPTVRTPEAPCCHSPSRGARCCLPPWEMGSATPTTIDFGAIFPFTCVPAYSFPVYASQRPLPNATQDSVRGCWLGLAAVAISGACASRAFKAQPPQIRTCGFCRIRLLDRWLRYAPSRTRWVQEARRWPPPSPRLVWPVRLSVVVTWRRDPTSVCWPSFPPPVPPAGAPFPPRGLVGSIPPLRRYYETRRLLAAHPPALRCLRPAVPSEHLRLRSVGRQVLRPRPRAW